ncbi:ArsR/SmtB family transcription factor [Sinisalibacter aestuarii]|uniref:HTH arsR-type domain-containing protein n=1 Tax=Sinisalibacter aestuarii TaxID=2949426 RepID=A0ABQ5LS51_9RHOB|nr:winged helix-turn-helix domain-containing protein [Sinisalibacter aestuarii]GKY87830.1 hypothetical protein STA1M1_16990 [Sinisalibacter aestuarii]
MFTDETLALNFKALSHPRRAMLFRLLVNRPEAGDNLDRLIAESRLSYSTAIHHLREMERCGLVQRQRRGVHTAYRLAPGAFARALAAVLRMSEAARAKPRRVA